MGRRTASGRVTLLAIWMTLTFVGCSSLPALPPPETSLPPAIPSPTRVDVGQTIGPEDVLGIQVYGHADLSVRAVVDAGGGFSYPLLGTVQAQGLTVPELERRMGQALAKYIIDPQVSVTVEKFQSQQVYVVGEVKTPQTYALKHATTLVEILSEAGGPTAEAGWEVLVIRARTASHQDGSLPNAEDIRNALIRVALQDVLSGHLPQPIRVQGGDTVYVPRAGFFYISGQVVRPGRYRLERDTTVAKAVTVAGGFTQFAARGRLKVRRLVDGRHREFQAVLTDPLQAEDEVIVPESVF